MGGIFLGYFWNILEILLGFFWEILLGFLRILRDSLGRFFWEILLGFFWDSFGILLGFFWDSFWILLGFLRILRDSLGRFFRDSWDSFGSRLLVDSWILGDSLRWLRVSVGLSGMIRKKRVSSGRCWDARGCAGMSGDSPMRPFSSESSRRDPQKPM